MSSGESERRRDRVPVEWFEHLYAGQRDPWSFETSTYERRKYLLTVVSLPLEHYRSGFEPGCSTGVLTGLLAPRCERLLATDVVAEVVQRAATRTADCPGVTVEVRAVPDQWPAQRFDLVVLSELLYYFPEPEVDRLIDLTLQSLEPGGTLVAVHWRGPTDYPLSGDEVHQRIRRNPLLRRQVDHRERLFLLGCWERTGR